LNNTILSDNGYHNLEKEKKNVVNKASEMSGGRINEISIE
jgi:hypothetical protein